MLIVYVLSLGLACAFVGSFVRGVFAQFGYIPGLASAAYITLGAALLYAGIELLYVALLRIYQPTRGRVMLATESCSHLAAILLIPALLNASVPGMTGSLERAAPLVFLAAFGAVHLFFKLASFYAALTGPEDPERPVLSWTLSGLAASVAGTLLVLGWRGAVEDARIAVSDVQQRVAAGTQLARARLVPEGATVSGSVSAGENATLALRFAAVPPDPDERPAVARVYVTVTLNGRDSKTYQGSVALRPDGWAELLVPPEYVPANLSGYSIYWTRSREPNWQRILGLRPIVYNLPATPGEPAPLPAQVYFSGPDAYSERPAARTPNLLVVLVDGLGADHLSLFGYSREVTPAIDRVGYRAQLFPETISPGASAAFALSAIMTGEDPAQLDGAGPAPTLADLLHRSGYATVAFIESADHESLSDAPWAQGFDVYDDLRAGVADDEGMALGAVARAQTWIADHQLIPFLCVVRTRALAEFPPPDGAAETFKSEGDTLLDVDRFDNALLALDHELGALFKFIRDYETRSNTCIVVTAPYGHTFSPGASRKFLGVPSERVPLLIEIPDRRQRKIPKPARLHDLGATLAYLAGVRLPSTADGVNLVP